MTEKDLIVFDEIIENTLDITRVGNRITRKVLIQLQRMQRELIAQLAQRELTTRAKRDIQRLLKQSREAIDLAYINAAEAMDLEGVATAAASSARSGLVASFAGQIGASLPPVEFFESIASSAFIQGAPAKEWWALQAFKTKFAYNRIVRQGLIQGTPNGTIIAQIKEQLGIQRRHAAALVQTSTMSVANESRLATFDENDDLVKAYIWRTALDGHVCPQCMARADLKWSKDKKPVGHSMDFVNPPIHFNDRCVLSVELKSFRELGLDIDEVPKAHRASDEGRIKATTFEAFLNRKSKAQQNEMLGVGRADLWRKGTITLQDLVSNSGRELKLSELKLKHKTRAS